MFRTRWNRNEVDYPPENRVNNDSDLSDIPSQLRQVLEECLARDASPRVLEIYLPKVREIVINLLQGLKRKQARYRARTHDTEDNASSKTSTRQRSSNEAKEVPSKDTSVKNSPGDSERRRLSPTRRPIGAREESTDRTKRDHPRDIDRQQPQPPQQPQPQPQPEITAQPASPDVVAPPPTNEALQKLQISDALQRRASKRYSAYNFAKLDGLDMEAGNRNPPPIPSRRSGSHSSEMTRGPPSPEITKKSQQRRRSPERRAPIDPPLAEEDESMSPLLRNSS
jgi:hypothetical protein